MSATARNGNPYTASCEDPNVDTCTLSIPARTLGHWPSNAYVPAYQCPVNASTGRGYFPAYALTRQSYAPWGTDLPLGVEVLGLGPVGVSISGIEIVTAISGENVAIGTYTDYPNSSATSWSTQSVSYQVILHCASSDSSATSLSTRPVDYTAVLHCAQF